MDEYKNVLISFNLYQVSWRSKALKTEGKDFLGYCDGDGRDIGGVIGVMADGGREGVCCGVYGTGRYVWNR